MHLQYIPQQVGTGKKIQTLKNIFKVSIPTIPWKKKTQKKKRRQSFLSFLLPFPSSCPWFLAAFFLRVFLQPFVAVACCSSFVCVRVSVSVLSVFISSSLNVPNWLKYPVFFPAFFSLVLFVQWSLGLVVLLFSVLFSVCGAAMTIILHYLMWFPKTFHNFAFQMYHTYLSEGVNESWCEWYCHTIELKYSDTMSLWYCATMRL